MSDNPFRRLPAVNAVLDAPALRALAGQHSPSAIREAVRAELAELRRRLAGGGVADGEAEAEGVAGRAAARLVRGSAPRVRRVINATGVVLHTNLGRAPMAEAAARAAAEAAAGYLNLEMDLETGKRSSRQAPVREWLCRLTGAESATAVNNNAAATVIALRAVAGGREVIVSRGQLIEIGGSFRIPDIMAVSGAVLREVGTTNITRLADYERAIGPGTAALLRVHTSNYRVSGFTRSVELAELVALGRKHNLPVIDDIGSGALVDLTPLGFRGEPVARESVTAGADLVLFSGDKLLGGPQAGLIVGKSDWVRKIEKDPLMRAFRLDKMTLAALEATLRLYLREDEVAQRVPVLRLLGMPAEELRGRAEGLAAELGKVPGLRVRVVEGESPVGGGSLPEQAMKGWVVEVEAEGVRDAELVLRLRLGEPAVVGRLCAGRLVLDPRTVLPGQEGELVAAVGRAVAND